MMETKVVNFVCEKCRVTSNGKILLRTFVTETCTVVKFQMECCGAEFLKLFTPNEIKFYVKEVKSEEED